MIQATSSQVTLPEQAQAAAEVSGAMSVIEMPVVASNDPITGVIATGIEIPAKELPNNGASAATSIAGNQVSSWDYTKDVSRPTLIAKIAWSASSAALTSLGTFTFPQDFMVNDMFAEPFANQQMFRCDLNLIFEVTGNPFYSGRLKVAWYPVVVDMAAQTNSRQALSTATGPYIDASQNYRVVQAIPFTSNVNMLYTVPFDTANDYGWYQGQLGTVGIYVWNQLYLPTGAPATVTVSMYAFLTNAIFNIPNPIGESSFYSWIRMRNKRRNGFHTGTYTAGTLRKEFFAWKDKMKQVNSGFVRQGGVQSTTNNTNYEISNSSLDHTQIPTKITGPQQTVAPTTTASVATGNAKSGVKTKEAEVKRNVLDAGGKKTATDVSTLDHPNMNDTVNRIRVVRAAGPNMNNVRGITAMDRMSSAPNSLSLWSSSFTATHAQDTAFDRFIHNFSWVDSFNVSTSNTTDTVLKWGFIAPMNGALRMAVPASLPYNVPVSLNDYVALHHRFWRGGLLKKIIATCSNYHSCRLIFATHYGFFGDPSALTATQRYSTYHCYIDLRADDGKRAWVMKMPWHASNSSWKGVPTGMHVLGTDVDAPLYLRDVCLGTWSISIASLLTASSDVSSTIVFDIEEAGAEDMMYYGIDAPAYAYTFGSADPPTAPEETVRRRAIGFKTQVGEEEVDAVVGPSDIGPTSADNDVVSEGSVGFTGLMSRWQPFASFSLPTITTGTATATAQFRCYGMGVGTLFNLTSNPTLYQLNQNGTTDVIQPELLTYPTITQLASIFRMWRGSIRFMFEFRFAKILPYTLGTAVGRQTAPIEIEWLPAWPGSNYHSPPLPINTGGLGTFSTWMYNYEAYGMTAGLTASIYHASEWTRAPSGTRVILDPEIDSKVMLEIPFTGLTPMRLTQPASGEGLEPNNPYEQTNLGFFFVRFAQVQGGQSGEDAVVIPNMSMRILVSAGDDFNLSNFITLPKIYLNPPSYTGKTGYYLPFGWTADWTAPTESAREPPKRLTAPPPRAQSPEYEIIHSDQIENFHRQMLQEEPKVVVPASPPPNISFSPDALLDRGFISVNVKSTNEAVGVPDFYVYPGFWESEVVFPVAIKNVKEAFGKDGFEDWYTITDIKPGSFAHKVCGVLFDGRDYAEVEGTVVRPTFVYRMTPNPGKKTYYHQMSMSVPGHSVDETISENSALLNGEVYLRLYRLLNAKMLRWAAIFSNDTKTGPELVHAWIDANDNDLKTPLTIINEMCQQISGLTLIVEELPSTGPQHQQQHPSRIRLVFEPDHVQYVAEATTSSRHLTKREAAHQLLSLIRGHQPVVPLKRAPALAEAMNVIV